MSEFYRLAADIHYSLTLSQLLAGVFVTGAGLVMNNAAQHTKLPRGCQCENDRAVSQTLQLGKQLFFSLPSIIHSLFLLALWADWLWTSKGMLELLCLVKAIERGGAFRSCCVWLFSAGTRLPISSFQKSRLVTGRPSLSSSLAQSKSSSPQALCDSFL